jgi:outer membrane protein TolC
MKKSLLLIKLLLINILFVSELYADTLTLQESIEKALLSHPDIKSFMLKVKQSEKNYDTAFADYLPQINLHAEYNPLQTFALPVNGVFNTIDDDGWGVGVSLKQKIWDFSQTLSKIKASKMEKEISQLSFQEAKALMAYKVKSLYGLVVVYNEAIEVRKKDLGAKKAYYAQAKARVKQGLTTDADASRFLSSVYVAKDNLAVAIATYEKAKLALSLCIGEEITNDTELEYNFVTKEYDFEQDLEKEILNSNYKIQIETQNIYKNSLLYKSAQASHYGSLDAVVSYYHLDTLNSYDSRLIGITYAIPLYSGGKISAETQKAKIGIHLAREQKASKVLEVKEEIGSLLLDIQRYDATIEAKQAQENSANQTQKVLEARYKAGLSTYIGVLDSISLVLNAKLGVLEAYYLRITAINRLEYLKGQKS